jgi:DNA uptake protein ComE-like DNA-binding protein
MFGPVGSFFKHHRAERRGAIILGFLILVMILATSLANRFVIPKPGKAIVYLIESTEEPQGLNPENLFQFNPNTLNDSGYMALGFSEKEIATLRKYQAAGGHFAVRSDFSRLFFVDSIEYELLEPYIQLPDTKPQDTLRKKSRNQTLNETGVRWSDTANYSIYEYREFSCELNSADTTALKRLKGIGSYYAREIVRYREALGGYHSLGQLLELYKMTPDKIDAFAHQVQIDQNLIRKLKMNSATAQELAQHPYINLALASELILYREAHGNFENSGQVCGSGLLDAELCRKLAPYLSFD